VIDPRVTSYAKKADLHAQLRPGTDGALVLGMLHVIIKEGLYDEEFVEKWTTGFEKLALHIEQYSPEKVAEITWSLRTQSGRSPECMLLQSRHASALGMPSISTPTPRWPSAPSIS